MSKTLVPLYDDDDDDGDDGDYDNDDDDDDNDDDDDDDDDEDDDYDGSGGGGGHCDTMIFTNQHDVAMRMIRLQVDLKKKTMCIIILSEKSRCSHVAQWTYYLEL